MKVAYDIDDVLARCVPEIFNHIGRDMTYPIHIWDFEKYSILGQTINDELKYNPRFWIDLPMISFPDEMIVEPTCYITSSPKEMVSVRHQWLVENGFPDVPVHHSKNKLDTMIELGIDVLVDDSPHTFDLINQKDTGKLCVQFVPNYMSVIANEKLAIRNLSTLKYVIENYQQQMKT